jgi:hydrogenase nickel incorporation protein HypA/HybF
MHEWALADAVVSTVLGALEGRDPRSLRRARVVLGELQAVDREVFLFGLRALLEPHGISADSFVLETQPAEFLCGHCGRRWGLAEDPGLSEEQKEAIHFLPEAAHAFSRCPACGSADFRVEKGRGVAIDLIELEGGEADPR